MVNGRRVERSRRIRLGSLAGADGHTGGTRATSNGCGGRATTASWTSRRLWDSPGRSWEISAARWPACCQRWACGLACSVRWRRARPQALSSPSAPGWPSATSENGCGACTAPGTCGMTTREAVHPARRHAAVLAFEGSPLCLAAGYELLSPMAGMLDEVAEAFRTGQGIPHERYPDSLYAAMERMSASWLDAMLADQWLPAVDGLVGRLERGGKVADIGSGGGRAVITMARRFPHSEFVGYDLHEANVERATVAAKTAGVANYVRFVHADAMMGLTGPLDLVTMFDVLHDAPDPEALLATAHTALAHAAGVLLVLESSSAAVPEDNAGPPGTILYATSTLYCVPTALADGGPAFGTLGLPVGGLGFPGAASWFLEDRGNTRAEPDARALRTSPLILQRQIVMIAPACLPWTCLLRV